MSAEELLTEIASLGIELRADGDLLLYRPVEAVSVELLSRLRTHKDEIIDRLTWPEECLAAEQEHGRPLARLYPLLGRPVSTPLGQGRLVAVLPEQAFVILRRRSLPLAFLPGEVAPSQFLLRPAIRATVH